MTDILRKAILEILVDGEDMAKTKEVGKGGHERGKGDEREKERERDDYAR